MRRSGYYTMHGTNALIRTPDDDVPEIMCMQCGGYVWEHQMVHDLMCLDCFTAGIREYECYRCDHIFKSAGIPLICPQCCSVDIHSEWSLVEREIQRLAE